MDLLVFGGTSFAGRHVVEHALADGHTVTVFNRGRTNPRLFPTVQSLRGDRTSGDYDELHGAGPFDVVVDMCAYVPRAVREAAAALGPDGLSGPYILISSVSAYAHPAGDDHEAEPQVEVDGFTEASPLAPMPDGTDPASEEVTGETYGPLKVLTEAEATALLPGRVMVIRPGLIVGPHDPTDRFTYWVRRLAEGGEVLAPESPDVARTQVIDAADLAEWIVASAVAGRTGVYNAVAPPVPLARVFEAAKRLGAQRSGGPHHLGTVGVPRGAGRRPLDRSSGLASRPHGRTAGRRRVQGRERRAALPADRGRGRRPAALGQSPAAAAAPGRADPGAGGGAAQPVPGYEGPGGGPAARAMSQPRARSARG